MTTVPAVLVPAVARQTSAFIFLHGLGDTGHGWASIAENWRLRQKLNNCAFIFPHAPSIPIAVNMGMRMPAWFDITSFSDISMHEDQTSMLKSVDVVHGIIEEQIAKGIPSERIVVGGFSQGGAIALLSGLTCRHQLGGVVALSTWLPMREKIIDMATEANKDTKIFQAHGEVDNVVRFEWATRSRDLLKERLGRDVAWNQYPNLDHSADPQEINDLERWLEKRIPDESS